MAGETKPRPGVEVEQKFVTASPVVAIPSLVPCIIGPAIYIVDVFNVDGTINQDSKITDTYKNVLLTTLQTAFPDPRAIIDNVDVDEASIRAFITTGSGGALSEVLRTEAFLAPSSPPDTGTLVDDGSAGTLTKLFRISVAGSGLTDAADLKAGDKVFINGKTFQRTVASAVDNGSDIDITLDTGIAKSQIGSFNYHIIATSDLSARSLTGFLTIGGAGEAIIAAGFIRSADGTVAPNISAEVFISFEALRRDLSASPLVGDPTFPTINDQTQLDLILGPISLRNPLSVGGLFALINSPNNSIKLLGIDATSAASPDGTLVSYNRAFSFLEGKEVYALAPLTQDPLVHQTGKVHVVALSAKEQKRERMIFVNQSQPSNKPDETKVSGTLANTIERSTVLTEGADVSDELNARMEVDMGSLLTEAGVVGAADLVKAGKLRDADLYLQIGGEQKKFAIRTIVGPDLEIIEEAIASDATTAGTDDDKGAIFGTGAMVHGAGIVTITFAQVGGITLEDAGVRVGDLIDIIAESTGTVSLAPDPLVVKTISGNVVTADTTAGDFTSLDEYRIRMVDSDYDLAVDGFEDLAIGVPFANQIWALRILGAPLVLSGTVPPILDKDGIVEGLATIAATFGTRRVLYVQPDTVVTTAITGQEDIIPGHFLCAALAGMTGEQPPQQPFTNFPIAGFTRLINSNEVFSDRQIDIARAGGIFWVVQEAPGAAVLSVHQLTTDLTSIETQEFSITKVVDFVAKFLRAGLRRFIGRFVITAEFLDQLGTIIQGLLSSLVSRGILNGAELQRLVVDETQPDAINVDILLDVPFPSNFIRITLIV